MFHHPYSMDDDVIGVAEGYEAHAPAAGYGRCNRCTCAGFTNHNQNENDYCDCGHPYSEHW